MAAIDAGRVAWWREPTKDQWYAWWAAWLGWTLDAFDFTVFLLIIKPIADEFHVPTDRGRDRLHADLVDAACRRGRLGLACRPDRPQDAADDLDLLVLGLQLHRRLLADLLVPVDLPHAARHRHGRGMAGRRGTGDGAVADPLARLYERRAARLVEHRLSAVERDLRPVLRLLSAGAACCGSAFCRRCRSFMSAISSRSPRSGSRTAASSATKKREVRAPLIKIFQRGMLGNTLSGLLVDGEQFRPLLLDLGAVCDASAGRPEADARWARRCRSCSPTSSASSACVLGLDGRHHRPPLGDDHPGRDRDPDRAALPVHQRRDSGSRSALACRAPSAARSTASCRAICRSGSRPRCAPRQRLLLPPGGDLRRLGGAGAGLFANYNLGYAVPMLIGTVWPRSASSSRCAQPRDQGQGARGRSRRGVAASRGPAHRAGPASRGQTGG